MRYGHDQPEAPTHLGSHQLPLPPEWLRDAEDASDPATAARGDSSSYGPAPRVATERSLVRPQLVSPKRARASEPKPAAPSALPLARDRSQAAQAPLPREKSSVAVPVIPPVPREKSAASPLPREKSS